MKMDKTSRMMAAGDICEFSNCSLFHHIKLSSPNLQTRRNRLGASAEWAAVSKDQLDACYRKGFCCRSSTFQNAWVLENEQIVPSSPFSAISPFSFPHAWSGRRRRSAGVNSLSDEKDKWWGCFGSGDSVAGKTESVREREGQKQGVEWWKTEGDRCQLPGDFRHNKQPSSLSDARTMTSIQRAASHVFFMTQNHHQLVFAVSESHSARGVCCWILFFLDSFNGFCWNRKLQKEMNEFRDLVVHSFSTIWSLRGQDLYILAAFSFCWGNRMWSRTQINHQKTADPQNVAFGGFYTHMTRNQRALWVVH